MTNPAEFLKLLDPQNDLYAFTTRTIDRKDLTRVFHGSWEQCAPKLGVFNSQLGADIWVTVNRTNDTGRTAADITHLRAFFADCDHGAPAAWPLHPNLVVESSPGKVQAYWLLKEPVPVTPEIWREWQGIEAALVKACGADENAKDIARVLRLPGFVNHKYPEKPQVRVIWHDNGRHTFESVRAVFGFIETPVHVEELPVEGDIEPEEVREARYRRWLEAVTDPPESGGGKRNLFFFKKAAYGVRDLALGPDRAALILEEFADRWYTDGDYHYERLLEIANNAAKHGRHAVGKQSAKVNIIMEDEQQNSDAAIMPAGAKVVAINSKSSRAAGGGAGGKDDPAAKVRLLATLAKSELSGHYVVVQDDKGITSFARVVGPCELRACDPAVVVGDMIRHYGSQLTPSKIKHELLPSWAALSEKVNATDISPFVFKSAPKTGWTWQRLGFDPDPLARCPDTLRQVLARTSEAEGRSLVLWLGSVLDYNSPRTQYLYLHGNGNDGKSTLLRAVMSVFADQGVASLRSDEIGNHGTAKLEGARFVCFMDENNSSFMSTGLFKAITGDDFMTINPKYQAHRNIKVFCKVAIASNNPPTVSGDRADLRRIIPVRLASFENIAGDQGFEQQMLAQAPDLMRYCYSQYAQWRDVNPGKLLPVDEVQMEQVRAESLQADVEDLVNSLLVFDKDARVAAQTIKALFDKGNDQRLLKRVAAYLRSQGCQRITAKQDGAVRRYWTGAKVRQMTVSVT